MAWLGVRAACAHRRARPQTTLRDIAVLLMAGLFFLSPNYAWYFLAVVPFIALGGGAPAWAMTLAAHPALPAAHRCPTTTSPGKRWPLLPFVIAVALALMLRGRQLARQPRSLPMDELTIAARRQRKPVDARRYFEAGAQADRGIADKPPVCLYLEVTNRCNLLCTTCPRTYAELEPPADMSWELFTRIVDQVPGPVARRPARRRRADAGEEPAAAWCAT